MDPKEYFERKCGLLRECVSLSEEILSNIADIDTVNELLSAREEKIALLQELDDARGKAAMASLPDEQKAQIDQTVALLLGLDRDAVKEIESAQDELKRSMRTNTQTQKLVNYANKYVQTSGKLLDKRK